VLIIFSPETVYLLYCWVHSLMLLGWVIDDK